VVEYQGFGVSEVRAVSIFRNLSNEIFRGISEAISENKNLGLRLFG